MSAAWVEHRVSFRGANAPLAGTVTLPTVASVEISPRSVPAMLLIPGSGPVDRDSNVPRLPLGVTSDLAHALAEAGVASLRYDKRGVGASGGGDWREAGLWDLLDDARMALDFLADYPAVDAARLGVLGHSEGALLATRLTATDPRIRSVVLVSPSASSGEETLTWQARMLTPTLPALARGMLRILRIDPVAKAAKTHARIRATTADVERIGGVRMNTKWFREFMTYDPRADLASITVPTLAITGAKDLQVNPNDLAVIASLVQGPVETHLLPDVTHILRRDPGPPTLRSYRLQTREPLDAEVLRLVSDWARAHVADPRSA